MLNYVPETQAAPELLVPGPRLLRVRISRFAKRTTPGLAEGVEDPQEESWRGTLGTNPLTSGSLSERDIDFNGGLREEMKDVAVLRCKNTVRYSPKCKIATQS
jgi:hypothetical protein